MRHFIFRAIPNQIEVLKPQASILLTFIGVCTAIIAGNGFVSPRLLLIAFTILVASAGANGLTNYLDRNIDAKMKRTMHRALPSRRIHPPEKVLPLTITLSLIGLALSWYLHPYCFIADALGTIVALVWRKRATCVFPQGMIASCAPVLIGWFAVTQVISLEIVLLCVLIGLWLPLHVWSVMIAHWDDYINSGLHFFPFNRQVITVVKVLLLFSVVLGITAIMLYFMSDFGLLYLISAVALSTLIIYSSFRLVISGVSKDAWRLYKLSSIPYLGLIFLTMCLDIWLI
ncbi:protoheme IX farnesyltransferase [Chloroflexota bacterium]